MASSPTSPLFDWLQSAVADRGAGTAVVFRDTYLSWRGLAHRVERRGHELASMGIAAGDRIGLLLGNVPDLVILCLASLKIGAVPVPLDPTLGGRDLDILLTAVPMRALVMRPHGEGTPGGPIESPTGTVIKPRAQPEARRRIQGTLLTLLVYKAPEPKINCPNEVGAAILLTSDAAGDPKGVIRGPAQTTAIADAAVAALGLTPDKRVFTLAALHTALGFDFGFAAALRAGATLVLDEEVAGRRLAKSLRETPVDVLLAAPALYDILAREATARPFENKAPVFISAGGALAASTATSFFERYNARIRNLYIVTEAGPLALDDGTNPSSVGVPLGGVELRLGAPSSEGGSADGIWARPSVGILSFLPEPLAVSPRASAVIPVGHISPTGWLRTGDRGAHGRDGRLLLTGREDDQVKIDGKRVALGEVAAWLEQHPKVKTAEAIVREEFGFHRLVARVIPASPTCKVDDLLEHCALRLAPHKVPRTIDLVEDL